MVTPARKIRSGGCNIHIIILLYDKILRHGCFIYFSTWQRYGLDPIGKMDKKRYWMDYFATMEIPTSLR